jgi:hypothetical protein
MNHYKINNNKAHQNIKMYKPYLTYTLNLIALLGQNVQFEAY